MGANNARCKTSWDRQSRPFVMGLFVACLGGMLLSNGCATFSHHPPTTEAEVLSNVVQLTHASDFDRAGEGYFSKDMKWMIFQAAPHGAANYQMYVAAVEWEKDEITGLGYPQRISPPGSRNTCGYFSPDGKSLIFASTAGKDDPSEPTSGYQREGGSYRWSFPKGMEIYRADDWQLSLAARRPFHHLDLARHALTDNDTYDAEGAYSPDGKSICFTSMRSGDGDVYVMKADGTNVVRITTADGYDGGPFFSPDGNRLVYRSDRHHNNLLQVFTCDLVFDGAGNITGSTNERQLTNDANVNWGPYWHPDGQHIIYATSKHGHANYELYVMRTDGSHATRVTFMAGADILPVFSPDGKYLTWTSTRLKAHQSQIYVAQFHPPSDW